MKLRTSILAAAMAALLPAAHLGAEPAASPLEGLWEVISITNLTTGKVQPKNTEYHMYTATHEMIILTGKDRKIIKKSLPSLSAHLEKAIKRESNTFCYKPIPAIAWNFH